MATEGTTPLQLLTLAEAAKRLGLCSKTLSKLIARGKVVPIYPTGSSKPRITTLELERYIRAEQTEAWDAQEIQEAAIRQQFSLIQGRAASATRKRKAARV